MKTVRNTTNRPLRITLHGDHVLHLAPHKTGHLADADAERPSLRRLIDSGEIALLEGAGAEDRTTPRAAATTVPAHPPHKTVTLTGGRTAGGRREN